MDIMFKRRRYIRWENDYLPLISIVLPALNAEKTIYKAISSIQGQTYKNWELLIIDDGSNDHTYNFVSQLQKKDARIKLYRNPVRKGVAYSKNIGLYNCKGELITFHDADDRSHPKRLEAQLKPFFKKASLKVVTFFYIRETEKRIPLIMNGKKKSHSVSGMMIKKEVFMKVGYFKPLKVSEDSEYYQRILAVYGRRCRKRIKKILYYALFHRSSLLFTNSNITIQNIRINYKIKLAEDNILKQCLREHKQIKKGKLDCYQDFNFKINPHLTEND